MKKQQRLTANNFFIGIISALKLAGIETINVRGVQLCEAFAKLFKNELTDEAEQNNLDLRFRIRSHPIHGDSQTVYDGILWTMSLGMVTRDSPGETIRLKITPESAEYG